MTTTRLQLHLSPELVAWLKETSGQQRRSMSSLAEELMEFHRRTTLIAER